MAKRKPPTEKNAGTRVTIDAADLMRAADRLARPRFTIIAEHLLCGLQAVTPMASKDEESPHLTVVKFEVSKEGLSMYATDGHALGKLMVPCEEPTTPTWFNIQTTHIPSIVKLLSRLDQKQRAELEVGVTVGKFQIEFVVSDAVIKLPKNADQKELPYSKVIPDPIVGGRAVATQVGINPELLAKALRCAARISSTIMWTAPETMTSAIRIDIVELSGTHITGLFVVMPKRIGEDGDDSQDDAEDGDPDSRMDELFPAGDGASAND